MTGVRTRVRQRLLAAARLRELAPLQERLAEVEADVAEERGLRLGLEDHVAALEGRLGTAYRGAGAVPAPERTDEDDDEEEG